MSYEDRITRMREQGILTGEQAIRLRNSLGHTSNIKKPETSSRDRLWKVVTICCVIATLFVIWVAITPSPEINSSLNNAQDVRSVLNNPQEVGNMGKSLSSGLSVALFLLIPLIFLLIWFVSLHNGLVNKDEKVFEAWAQVESNYQRRADLIPNMLETVAKYMSFEQETLVDVVGERSKAMNTEVFSSEDASLFRSSVEEISKAQEESARVMKGIDSAPQNDSELENLHVAQKTLGTAMHRIIALSENYPTLRSADQMLTLQAELEGSENRINIARIRFNEAASEFNSSIRRIPANLIASIGGFKRKAYFKSDAGAEKPVQAEFE